MMNELRARRLLIASLALLALTSSRSASGGLFQDANLSQSAQNQFLIHFDAAVGVQTTGANVDSWDGMDGDGTSIVATASLTGGDNPANITHNGSAVVFSETVASNTTHLQATLDTSGNQYTIFWQGHYDSTNQNGAQNSGLYAYTLTNLNVSNAPGMNHQRDAGGGGYRIEVYPGTTYAGDDITANDDTSTTWTTIYDYANGSHTAFANGANLNLGGSSSLSLNAIRRSSSAATTTGVTSTAAGITSSARSISLLFSRASSLAATSRPSKAISAPTCQCSRSTR